MIDLSTVSKEDSGCYQSAYARCISLINEKGVDNKTAIGEIVKKFSPIVENAEKLEQYLFEQLSIEIEPETGVFSDEVRHSTWWTNFVNDENTDSKYWNRYERYLTEKKGWDLRSIEKNVSATTDRLMNALSNPLNRKDCERYGVVFGYVQSGKTANFIGLINKAIDAGYKIIVILAGMHNSLRSQTQSRIDEEVLGYETSLEWILNNFEGRPTSIGVGTGRENQTDFLFNALTSRDEKGDFNKKRAGVSVQPPILLVAKKNATVLSKLVEYFQKLVISQPDKNGDKFISNQYPLLMIDDEADQASLNTNASLDENGELLDDYNPTKINALIRSLLKVFKCKSYVGYTATPYANIFVPDKAFCQEYGNDLFPKDFIVKLPRNPKYIGAQEFFGITGNDDNESVMPLTRKIEAGANYLPKGSTKDIKVGELPIELKEAVNAFVISIAVRNCRGHINEPNTMLIHILRFKDTQKKLKTRVDDYYEEIRSRIKYGDVEIAAIFHRLWQDDFEKTTFEMKKKYPHHMQGISCINWDQIFNEIRSVMQKDQIKVYCINGDSKDSLIYKEHKGAPFNVIAIGGDKLSRGLTLEGLTVSYFTRNSNTYDTLMQMGRWFGYRPQYLDVCRLYVTKSLYLDFRHISMATEDLVDQIDYMNDLEETPEKFGLRVATHPTLLISSKNKVRTGTERKMSFSNTLSQTRMIDIDKEQYQKNFESVEHLLKSIGTPVASYWETLNRSEMNNKHLFWNKVNGYLVANFFTEYETSKQANRAQSKYMADYIKNQLQYGNLTNWTVCLVNVGEPILEVASQVIGKGIIRNQGSGYDVSGNACSIKTMTSKGHEYYDFTSKQMDEINRINEAKEEIPGSKAELIRSRVRRTDQGLLILYPLDYEEIIDLKIGDGLHKTPFGFAVVFPDNKGKGDLISYRLNDVGMRSEYFDFC